MILGQNYRKHGNKSQFLPYLWYKPYYHDVI